MVTMLPLPCSDIMPGGDYVGFS